jgi:hypothetical protein
VSHVKKIIPIGIFAAVSVFFGLALYWAVEGIMGSISYISTSYVYSQLSQGPIWWMILYYSGEGVAGTVGLIIRAVGGFFAFYAAVLFLWKKESALSAIKGKVGTALLLEGIYYFSLIPSTLTAFAYYFANGGVFYFDSTPPLILLFVAAIPTLATVTLIPIILFKLRSKIVHSSPTQDIVKLSSFTAFIYILVVFWFSYSMAWLGNMVPFDRARGQYGWSFLLEPVNLISFLVTVLGLLLVALFVLKLTFPTSWTQVGKISLSGLGVVMLAFGGYFIFNLLYFYLTGGYAPHPNVWYEMMGPPHNVNLWCLVFVFLGLALLISSRAKKNES